MARNYRIIEGAMYETVADETVIYAPGGNLYILNESAGLILRSVLNQGSPCEVTKTLLAEFDVNEQTVVADVDKFLSFLVSSGIVEECQ